MFEYLAGSLALAAFSFAVNFARSYYRHRKKGAIGERKVRFGLAVFFGKGFTKIHDLLLPLGKGTSQIDHVLVSRRGIIAIETKNFVGQVLGSAGQRMWLQRYRSGRCREFLNPLIQNEGHTRALRELLAKHGYPDIPIRSLVVFSNKCKIPNVPDVINMRFLRPAIRVRLSGDPIYSEEEVAKIAKIIKDSHIRGRRARRQHEAHASLAASAAQHQTRESVAQFLEEGMRTARPLSFGAKPDAPSLSPEQKKLTDAGAILNIRGRRTSIEDFFESAKRDANGDHVRKGANFDHFVCPYTGDSFPPSEAKSFYHGLWAAYFKRNPDLAAYLRENVNANLGVTFRCQKVLAAYARDPDKFISETRSSNWYQNMEKRLGVLRAAPAFTPEPQRKSLDRQIAGAESRRPSDTQHHSQDRTHVRS